ncbi:MAG TPA: hypothetical protein VLF15_12500 [Pseudoxanthomonas sp.]|nr:hypothetical protein [Pseudoxanthomonas sp.]
MNGKHNDLRGRRQLHSVAIRLIATSAVLALGIAEVSAARGGGGGRMAQSSVSGASRSMTRPSTGGASAGNRASTGNINTGNRANTGNVNTGNRVNTGNISTGDINIGNDVNIDVDGGYGYRGGYYHGGGYYHPVAAGMVIGATAVTTAAVLGSSYYALPPGCTVVVRAGVSYHYCGSVYYQQTWSGNDVVYVVVNP